MMGCRPLDRTVWRVCLTALFLILAATTAQAQLSATDLQNMPPTIRQLQKNRMTALTGLTVIDGDPFWRVDLRPDLRFGRLGIGLKAVLLIGAPDANAAPGDTGGQTKILTEDGEEWNSFGAYLRAVRYIQWASPRAPFYARYGELFDVTIGHGLLMDGYSNFDRRGIRLNANRRAWGFESMLNNLDDPNLLGGRAYVRPLVAAGIDTPIVHRLAIGASYLVDRDPIPAPLDPTAAIFDEDPLIAYAADAALPLIDTEPLLLELYDELGTLSYPAQAAGGSRATRTGNAAGVGLRLPRFVAKLEYRTFEAGFVPTLFGYNYEYLARTPGKGIQFDPSNDGTKGIVGTATLNLLDQAHIAALYEDYDGDGPVGEPRLSARFVETSLIEPVDIRAFYTKRGIRASEGESFLKDLVSLDEKSLFVVEIAYNLTGPVQIILTREFRFREREDKQGFEPIQKTTVQFGLNFGF